MMRGKFITFEGGEGAGKTTQVARLAERLRGQGIEVVLTREPGGTPLGEQVRELLLSLRPTLETEFLLFAAARAEHVATLIRPALAHGTWVLCDRFIDSTRVYQGALNNVDRQLIQIIEKKIVADCVPDLTLILDVPVDVARARTNARGELTRFDAEHDDIHRQRRDAFLAIASAEPDRCVVINADRTAEIIAEEIWQATGQRLLAGTT